jgi:uncharacterized membrane protein
MAGQQAPRGGRNNQQRGGQSRSNQQRGGQRPNSQQRGGQNRGRQAGNGTRTASRAPAADRARRAPVVTAASPADRNGQAAQPGRGNWLLRLPRSMGWLPFTTLVLSVIALVVSAYLTYTHYTNSALIGCSGKGDGCVQVQTSPESMVFGVFPVALLGLLFYVAMVVLNSPQAWRAQWPAVHWARLVAAVSGIGFVLYLVYAELIQIKAICKYCTSVHIITFILFALIVFEATSSTAAIRRQPALSTDKELTR